MSWLRMHMRAASVNMLLYGLLFTCGRPWTPAELGRVGYANETEERGNTGKRDKHPPCIAMSMRLKWTSLSSASFDAVGMPVFLHDTVLLNNEPVEVHLPRVYSL